MSQKNPSVGFSLNAIKVEQFATFEENFTPNAAININTQLQLKISPTDKIIGIFMLFSFIQAEKIIIKIIVSCHFKIEPSSWQSIKKDNLQMQIPKQLVTHLAMVTCGTTRGILFSKIENTTFSKIILPLINIEQLVRDDFFIDIK